MHVPPLGAPPSAVSRLVDPTAVDEDAVALRHHLPGLTEGMPHHLVHHLLPNAHRIMARHLDDEADSAIGGFSFSNLARVEWGQLASKCSILDWSSKSAPRARNLLYFDI